MKLGFSAVTVVIALVGGGFACGSSSSGGASGSSSGALAEAGTYDAPAPQSEAGSADAPAPVDHGAPSGTYPAFPPGFAQLKDQGGHVMKSPVIVAITWNSDASQATFDAFADAIGGTTYWKTACSEYGVGPAVSGAVNHVHIATPPPATILDSDIQAMVSANAGGAPDGGVPEGGAPDAGAPSWPAPSQDTIYAFFLPPGTSLQTQTFGGSGTQDACAAGEGGYHDQVTAAGVTTAYAVVPSCTFPGSANTAMQQTTMSMSHELLEASTDAQPSSGAAYLGFDDDHFSFDYFQELQTENGDACEFYRDSFFERKETTPVPFDAWVQRTWSNASAAAGHNPCVPAPEGEPYFNVTPLEQQAVNVTLPSLVSPLLPGLSPNTKGFKGAAGKSVTFAVGFYSDGPTSGPWSVSVAAGNPLLGSKSLIEQYNPSTVTASIDLASGQNGQKAYVTVDIKATGTLFAGEIVTVTSTLNGRSHYMPVWIAGN